MDTEQEPKYQWIESHCHSFDELIACLYDSPESFRIPEKYLEEYSKQELRCLNKLQSYLKAIGLKDYKENSEITGINEIWQKINDKKKKKFKR